MDWKRFCVIFEKLADPATPWAGQVGLGARVVQAAARAHLRLGWTRIGDLEQLEQLSSSIPRRERFLTN
jgi:hypothetical protein